MGSNQLSLIDPDPTGKIDHNAFRESSVRRCQREGHAAIDMTTRNKNHIAARIHS